MQPKPGKDFRTIWLHPDDPGVVQIIDQRRLPHQFVVHDMESCSDGADAIRDMLVRGAPLIGATAAWSLYLAAVEARDAGPGLATRCNFIRDAASTLGEARPTAVNLQWAIERCLKLLDSASSGEELVSRLRAEAEAICEEDVAACRNIGEHGVELLDVIAAKKSVEPVYIMTHFIAVALSTVNWGTA